MKYDRDPKNNADDQEESEETDEKERLKRFIWTENDFEILPPSDDEASN